MSRRMRLLLRFLASLCLVVALALAAAWVRSLWRNDSLFLERGPHGYFVASARGRVGVVEVPGTWHPWRQHWASYDLRTDPAVLVNITQSPDTDNLWVLLYGRGKVGRFLPSRWLAVPYAVPTVLFAAPPAVMMTAALRRRHRHRRGLCRACGYDLRGSPGRCPECGAERHDPPDDAATAPPATQAVAS